MTRRHVTWTAAVCAGLLLGAAVGAPAAEAATDRVLTISTATANPKQPFQAFDGHPVKVFDFNGDGKKEIIAQNDNRAVYVFSSTDGRILAELQTTYPSGWGARPLNGPEAAIFQQGTAAYIVLANAAAYVSVFRFDGADAGGMRFTKLWERRLTDCHGDPGMDSKPVLADLSGDGKLEILAQTEEVGVYALRMDGSTYWKQCIGGGNGEPAVADIDHDGVLDVVWASDAGVVTVMDGRGGWTKWSFWAGASQYNLSSASIPVGPTIAQVDGTGPLDIVFGARDSHDAQDFSKNHAALFVLKGSGGLLWMRQDPNGNPLTYTHPIVHDVDGDGQADVLWADWNTMGHKPPYEPEKAWAVTGPGNFYRYDAAGNLRWKTSLSTYWQNKDLALADVDGDGVQEVLANGPGSGGDGIWYLDSRTGAKETFVSTHPWKVSRGPVVADLRGDGKMQWVVPVTAADGSVSGGAILVYDTYQRYNAA